MTGYLIPARETRTETRVVNSKFVCTVVEAATAAAAQQCIFRVKTELFDASSHAFAYRVGFGGSVIDGCNDGGEPGGTAGRPMLAVLQGSGIGDIVAVVSRYFGGTELGTGGLVRAFGGAVKDALLALPTKRKIKLTLLEFELPYSLYERVKLLVVAHEGAPKSEKFEAVVTLLIELPAANVEQFSQAVLDMSAGSIRPKIA